MLKKSKHAALIFLLLLPFALSVCGNAKNLPPQSSSQSGKVETQQAVERRGPVRVFNRWKVKPNEEDNFVKAWTEVTKEMLAEGKGFRGSILLRNRQEQSEFLAIERWNSSEERNAFLKLGPSVSQAAKVMNEKGTRLSTQDFTEVYDLLDYSSWKTKMIRIYRLKVKDGAEETFIQTWQRVSRAISAKHKGARGALLVQDARERSSFMEVVRWDSLEDWQRFVASEPADQQAFKTIFELMTLQSTDVMDEVENLLAGGN